MALNPTSQEELRQQILKAGTVSKGVVTFRQEVHSTNTSTTITPITSTSQDVVEIGIDDLMQLIDQHTAEAVAAARLEELQLLIGTHNNDPSVTDYSVIRVTRELLNARMDALKGQQK